MNINQALAGPTEQFFKCGGCTRLYNIEGKVLTLKMVKSSTVINLNFSPAQSTSCSRPLKSSIKVLFIFGSVLTKFIIFPSKV